jgi:Na+/H+-translocating membrane pyrophosphatase
MYITREYKPIVVIVIIIIIVLCNYAMYTDECRGQAVTTGNSYSTGPGFISQLRHRLS